MGKEQLSQAGTQSRPEAAHNWASLGEQGAEGKADLAGLISCLHGVAWVLMENNSPQSVSTRNSSRKQGPSDNQRPQPPPTGSVQPRLYSLSQAWARHSFRRQGPRHHRPAAGGQVGVRCNARGRVRGRAGRSWESGTRKIGNAQRRVEGKSATTTAGPATAIGEHKPRQPGQAAHNWARQRTTGPAWASKEQKARQILPG